MALTKPQGNMVMKLGTEQASTSGTAIDFTGIPAGTTMIVVMLEGVSTDGTSELLLRLGDSGGIEDAGYASIVGGTTSGAIELSESSTVGFQLETRRAAATNAPDDTIVVTLTLKDSAGFTWMASYTGYIGSIGLLLNNGTGVKSLSAELTQLRITTAAGDTFDAGSINIAYI